ncbi:MFS transporter [uncultured Sphingomonas sp.]|uniref:MFS transporter n=1 Tax=uncultured Sphingomonas sp. TaxID=158754 RepID=UPI0035CBFD0D
MRPSRLVLFAAGDFACNLYWQSISLFLFFFYTDVLLLPPALAGAIAMVGAIWDALADLAVGIVAQRAKSYRRFVAGGSVPLGLAFVALFVVPGFGVTATALLALVAQIVFRTLYALVNVPYAAWSARISADSRDRSHIAGLRMLFGAAAASFVALTMPRAGHVIAAAGYAAVAVPLLWFVATRSREVTPPPPPAPVPIRAYLAVLGRNRAFVTLNLAMAVAGIAAAIVNQSVLYYFDHVVAAPAAGRAVLATMGVAGAACIPVWMLISRRTGPRATWFVASVIGVASLSSYVRAGDAISETQALLVALQIVFSGMNLAFWAMLPDTVEYGEVQSGVRVEALAFGVSAFVQKIALAGAAAAMGVVYTRIGYQPGTVQTDVAAAGIRAMMLGAPAIGLTIAALVMLANPLRRGVHARLVAALTQRRA